MKGLFAFRLSPELKTKLEQKASELDRTQTWVINQALTAYLGEDKAPQAPQLPKEAAKPVKQAKKAPSTLLQGAAKHSKGERYFDEATGLWRRK